MISVGDGGGKVPARAKGFEGAVAVAKFLRAMFEPAEANRISWIARRYARWAG